VQTITQKVGWEVGSAAANFSDPNNASITNHTCPAGYTPFSFGPSFVVSDDLKTFLTGRVSGSVEIFSSTLSNNSPVFFYIGDWRVINAFSIGGTLTIDILCTL
jgi:hypothetical protein